MSCFVSEPLPGRAFNCNRGALHVINAKLGAGVHAEVKFGQVAVEMLGVDMLVHANDAPLKNAEKSFERIGMYVTARPFELGMVNCFMVPPPGI